MSLAFGSKKSLNIQCLSRYVSKSFKTLKAESKRHFTKDLSRKLVVIVIISIPDPFNGFYKTEMQSQDFHGCHATKLEQTSLIENRWHSCDELLMYGNKTFCQYNAF